MEIENLKVKKREQKGKGSSRRFRRQGFIPGVFYGRGEDSVPLVLNQKDLEKILQRNPSEHPVITLEFDNTDTGGVKPHVLLQEIQHDPVSGKMLHADFHHIDITKKLKVKVEVVLTGKARGIVEEGGVLNFINREIEIECLPLSLPENIKVDISNLNINDTIHVKDLVVGEGMRILDDSDVPIVSVTPPHVEAEVKEEVAVEGVPAEAAKEEGKEEAKAAPKAAAPAAEEKAPKGKK